LAAPEQKRDAEEVKEEAQEIEDDSNRLSGRILSFFSFFVLITGS
jgi:hypothetical protein